MSGRNVAVLVGNGLSIAFNPDLNLQAITEEVLARIEATSGDEVVSAMKEIAEHALRDGVTSERDFERLVGAFGAERRTLGYLGTLADLRTQVDPNLSGAIDRVADFAREVRDTGISHVLEVICERSLAKESEMKKLQSLITAIEEQFSGNVTFGNLNYDTLLLAALSNNREEHSFADLADGRRASRTELDFGGVIVEASPLRRDGSFLLQRRVCLLHLHGSLSYWGTGERGYKVRKSELIEAAAWTAVREDTTDLRPLVVLATPQEKPFHVAEFPFSLAYEMFTDSLDDSDKWIIIGYSFRDEPVNGMLRESFDAQDERPEVLVVTHGEEPSRADIERAFGWSTEDGDSAEWLLIERGGADGAQETRQWRRFVAS